MLRKRRLWRNKSERAARRNTVRQSIYALRAGFEILEDRRMLTGYFDEIATKVDGALGSVTTALHAIDSLARLPLINKSIEDLSQVTDSLASFRTQLHDTLISLSPSSASDAIQNAIFGVLSPLNVLADKVSPSTIGPEDVVVNLAGSDVAISLNIGKSVTFSSAAGLGVDSVPFQPDAREHGSDGSFTIGLSYENLNFGFKNNTPYFSTDALNELQFKIYGYLPAEMTVGLGFLSLKAVDKTPEKTPDKADLSLTFSADITTTFSIANPQIGGGANLLLGLSSSFAAPGLPEFKTDFVFKWNLSNSSTPLSSGWGAPELAFNNVEMNIGSFLGNLVQPLAERAQDLLEPLQPIFDLITEPIPVIDDISAAIDGPVIDLVFMSKTLSAYPNMPQEFFNIIKSADKLRQFSQTVNRLAGQGADHWVPLGSFNISGPSGGSLLDAPLAALGNLGLSKWSNLIFSGGKLDLQGFKNAILAELPGGVGDEINSLFTALTGEVAGNGLTIDFPVANDPSGVAMAFLLGQQDSDLVTATANFKVAIDKLIDLSPIPGLIVGLRASGAFTAYAKMGYDIKGIQEAIAPLYAGKNFDASKIMDGLWIDRNTRLQGDGGILVTAGGGVPDVAEFTADGGLTSNLTITLSTNVSSQKIRPLAGELGNSLFNVSGTMDAVAQITLKAGFEFLGEWIGINKHWPFAEASIYKFDTSSIPVPPSMQPLPVTPPQLARYDSATRALTLNTGADGHLRGGGIGDQKDENYTIRRTPNGGLAVSAFGYVQKFNGPFDFVFAYMDDGNDRLHVIDPSSNTFYVIDGGDGDDNINVDGHVKVNISGGRGNDTLDGGSGRESVSIQGGPGRNYLSMGDGMIKDIDPGVSIFLDGGSVGRLTLDNSDDKVGSSYYFYDDPNNSYGTLTIVSPGPNGPISRVLNFPRIEVTLRAGSGNDHFYGWFPAYSTIYAGSGDDTWDFTYQQSVIPDLEYFMNYYGGPGRDTLVLNDTANDLPTGVYLDLYPYGDGPTSMISWGNRAKPTQLRVQGIDETSIKLKGLSGVEVNSWADGPVTVEAGHAQFNTDHYTPATTNIHVVNTPQLFFVDPSNTNTVKGMGIDEFGPYLGNPIDYYQWPKTPGTPYTPVVAKLRIDYDAVTTKVDFFGSLMTIEPSVMYSTRPWNFSFVGSAGVANILKIAPPDPNNPNVVSRDFNYRISSDSLTIGPMTIRAQFLSEYQLIGGQGSDTITIDSLPPNVTASINGGLGNDTLIIDNSAKSSGASWEINPSSVLQQRTGLTVNASSIEDTQVLSGLGDDQFVIYGDFKHPLTVTGGGGNDDFIVGYPNLPVAFNAPVRIDGGEGNDTFSWYGVNNGFESLTYPVIVDGGAGKNALVIDDQKRFTSSTKYEIYASRIRAKQDGYSVFADFNYDNMSAVTLSASDNDDTINVYGISSEIAATDQFKILGNGGTDTVLIHPTEIEGLYSLSGNLGISGGAGNDVVVVDKSTDPKVTNYRFYNQSGLSTTNVSGFSSARFGVDGDAEQLQILAGSGDDSFIIDSYLNFGTALTVKAGDGVDTLAIAPTNGLYNAVSKFARLSFDGGSGTDSFSLNNSSSFEAALYLRDGAQLAVIRLGTDYVLNMNSTQFENMSVTGGVNFDDFYVESLASGESIGLHGGGAISRFNVGVQGHNTQALRGQVIVDATNGGGNLFVDDSANTTGATVHIDAGVDGLLGNAPGDTLFGPGGSLQFNSLTDDPSNGAGMTLTLGSGPDTIFAAPQTATTLMIAGGAPNTGVGDRLYLALAGVQNPNKLTFGTGAGKLISGNRKDVSWTGIEGLDLNYVAPSSYLVMNTLDSGPGSLRQAILDANAKPNVGGADVIRFAIPGVGAHSILPLSPLPSITDPLVLDATTQPGYAGKPVIELNGSLASDINGLVITSGGTTVRGLAINRFRGTPSGGISISGLGGNVIQGNYIGTDLAGNSVFPINSQITYGVVIFGSDGNLIGTNGDGLNDSVEGNVISGNNTAGVLMLIGQPGQLPDNNVIAGNRIGTSADGNTALGNGRMGVFVLGSGTGNRIGTNSDGISDTIECNLVSGNAEAGIYLGGSGFAVAGNYIGTNAAGTAALPNGNGIRIERADNNRVGGTATAASNLIAYNNYVGVSIANGTGNSVLGNSIFSNGEIGIDLNASGDPSNRITLNDANDADSGPNNLQNFPKLAIALSSGSQTIIGGTLQSIPQSTFRIEFFASPLTDPSGNGEGQTYLGFVTATTDASGNVSFAASFSKSVAAGYFVSSTATDPSGNTSEFSTNVQVVATLPSNVAALRVPTINSLYLVTSPSGTSLTASASVTPGVTPLSGAVFPFGFLDFTVRNVAPGAAADVTIAGLDLSQVTDYYKNGPTPVNRSAHWYNFLFGRATDSDSAVGTGMEIANGNVVLHLIDGQRGDDDLVANGIIVDIGGPVLNRPPVAVNDSVSTNTNTAATINVLANDSDSDGTLKTNSVIIIGSAAHGTTNINSTTGMITYTPVANYTGLDSFTYQVKDNLGTSSNVATVSILVDTPPVAVNDTASTIKNAPVVINVLSNDRDSDGTINATTVTIIGPVSHGTTSVNATTGAITYTPTTNYFGPDSFTYKVKDNLGVFSNSATVSINVIQTGSISGKEYLDVTGNGLTADDLPLPGVKVYLDTNNNGAWNTGEPSSTTLADGSYAFSDLISGSYKVRQVTPAGYVQTTPATTDYYSVALTAGQNVSGSNFSNAALGNLNVLSNIVYVINSMTPVSDLRGSSQEGDTVQVSFTVVAGSLPQRLTLVSYTAPGSAFDANTAAQQKIFDSDTGVFSPGTYSLTVSNPHSYFQVDFVGGFAIDRLGPAGSNIYYANQNRLFSADNGGSHAVLVSPASLTGNVYRDANNNGTIDSGELPIAGVVVTATSGSTTQTVVTDTYGVYTFDNLPAGTYTIVETQPGDYTDGKDTLGNKGGTASNDKFSGITLAVGVVGTGYNFGEQQTIGSAVAGTQTQTVGWWNASTGQALIKALNGGPTAKNLGNWLSANFRNLFGPAACSTNDLTNKTNLQVAAFYQTLYANTARKPESEILALAFATYVTNSSLAGTTAASATYGFAVSATGLGASTINVGANGAAFGIKENSVLSVTELLSRANARARKGILWDLNSDGLLNPAESILRNQANMLFSTINNT